MALSVSFGGELRRRRVLAGLSLADLARRTGYSKGYLSKIERGDRLPTPALARRCDAALHAEGALIALLAPRAGRPAREAAEPAPALDTDWTLRLGADGHGEFGALLAEQPIRLRFAAAPGDLEAQAALLDATIRLGRTAPPATVLPVAIAQVHILRTALPRTRGRSRRALLGLAARAAEFTGWMAQESGDDASVLWWTDRAVEFARECGDRDLAEYADVRRALVTLYDGQPGATVRIAGRVRAAHALSPRVRWLSALREAQGHALAGESARCEAALDHAHRLRELAARDADAPLGTSVRVDVMTSLVRGWCLHDLGRPEEAAELLDGTLPGLSPSSRRSRVRFAVRRALALADAGEVALACAQVNEMIDDIRLIDSATVRRDLRSFAAIVRRRRAETAVAELWAELPSLLEPR